MRNIFSAETASSPVLIVAAMFLAVGSVRIASAQQASIGKNLAPKQSQIERGGELFRHDWTTSEPNSKGDGLGPMYNATSCVACHNLGGIGGAGKNEHNVELLSILIRRGDMPRLDHNTLHERMTHFEPAFVQATESVRPSAVLHKFSVNRGYAKWRSGLLEMVALNESQEDLAQPAGEHPAAGLRNANAAPSVRLPNYFQDVMGLPVPVQFQLTRRNTPALFGAGLIDSIPDSAILDGARKQFERSSKIRGRVARTGRARVGKFGWRGQVASLKDFVMGACANEIGLQVPGHDQPMDPLDPTHKSPGLDMTQEQCDDLTAFVASLPPPNQQTPSDVGHAVQVMAGEQLFRTTGCAECHAQQLGQVTGIYSDLLLHDMGQELADPVPTASSARFGGDDAPSLGDGYYGGGNAKDVFARAQPEAMRTWRTPPLWGVADSGPYLHDGRAATLNDAIMAHGGEAENSKKNYAGLFADQRAKLLTFLNSLKAPR